MILSDNFIWLHLPRTGGSSTAAWMRQIQNASDLPLHIDPCDERLKHDNLATRFQRLGKTQEVKFIAMNFRPLSDWLISNHQWAQSAGLKVPIERYLEGEFFSLRMGRWCSADWWLDYFEMDQVTHLFWSETLESDWRAFLNEATGLSIPTDLKMERTNASRGAPERAGFAETFRESIATARNPKWSALEKSREFLSGHWANR